LSQCWTKDIQLPSALAVSVNFGDERQRELIDYLGEKGFYPIKVQTVYLQPVMVPHWDRGGKDVVKITNSIKHGVVELNALALGNTQGTGPKGLVGQVIEVKSIPELQGLGEKVKGKIVFFNGPMDPRLIDTFQLWNLQKAGGGADIGPLRDKGPILIGLLPDSQRYFYYHHTEADVFEAVVQRELELGAAAMASLVYLIEQEGI
jgi:hypothetical protein